MDDKTEKMINESIKERTKFWTEEDTELINKSMKNIASRDIWDAIYQAKKWAFLEARASVVKIDSEEERKKWFDEEISLMESIQSIADKD